MVPCLPHEKSESKEHKATDQCTAMDIDIQVTTMDIDKACLNAAVIEDGLDREAKYR